VVGIEPAAPLRPRARLVREWFAHMADTRLRQITWPEIERHYDCIVAMTRAGVTRQTIWQRLRDEHRLERLDLAAEALYGRQPRRWVWRPSSRRLARGNSPNADPRTCSGASAPTIDYRWHTHT
jgi:hypothetical protein